MKILISDYEDVLNRDLEFETALIKKKVPFAEIELYAYQSQEEFVEKMKEVEVLLTAFLPIDREVFERATKLKLISVNATGYGNIDMEEAKKHQVKVTTVKDYCTEEVADHAIALLLALARNLKAYDLDVNERHSWRYMDAVPIQRLSSLTMAIFGFGRIGRAVAKRAQAFGIRVVAVDPYVEKEEAEKVHVTMVTKEQALQIADIISNHMNQTKENEQYFNKETFDMMKRHPIFINVGRGSTVDEEDLAHALEQGIIGAAGIDVLKEEEPTLVGHPLLGRENVILTPHAAFYSEQSLRELQIISCENIAKEVVQYE